MRLLYWASDMTRRASRITTRNGHGFTIVELLIVVVVIAILAAITLVSYTGIQNSANDAAVQNDLRQMSNKLQNFYTQNGVFPTNNAQLDSLGMNVSKGSYGRHVSATAGSYNLLYCRPQSDPTKIALIASSSSGVLFQLVEGQITEIGRTSWDTHNIASATLCTNAGIPTSSAQVWFLNGGTWQSYSGS